MKQNIKKIGLICCLLLTCAIGAQAQAGKAQKPKWKMKPVKTYKQAEPQKDDGRDIQTFYAGLGYMIGKMGGVNIALGTSAYGHDLQLGFKLGLQKSGDLYWYGKDGQWQASVANYKQHSVDLHYGYRFLLGERFMATPQLGFRLHFLSGSVSEGSDDFGSGSMATSLGLGVRLSGKLAEHVHVFAAPEYSVALSRSNYFKQVEDWGGCEPGGFAVNVGVMLSL